MLKQIAMLGLAIPLTLAVTGCDVDVKEEGRMPNVDVDPGKAPDLEVHGPDVDMGTKEKDITVPDVDIDVDLKEKTITVPDIDINIPDEEDNEPVTPSAPPSR